MFAWLEPSRLMLHLPKNARLVTRLQNDGLVELAWQIRNPIPLERKYRPHAKIVSSGLPANRLGVCRSVPRRLSLMLATANLSVYRMILRTLMVLSCFPFIEHRFDASKWLVLQTRNWKQRESVLRVKIQVSLLYNYSQYSPAEYRRTKPYRRKITA